MHHFTLSITKDCVSSPCILYSTPWRCIIDFQGVVNKSSNKINKQWKGILKTLCQITNLLIAMLLWHCDWSWEAFSVTSIYPFSIKNSPGVFLGVKRTQSGLCPNLYLTCTRSIAGESIPTQIRIALWKMYAGELSLGTYSSNMPSFHIFRFG